VVNIVLALQTVIENHFFSFHKVVRWHFTGEVDNFTNPYVKFSHDSVHQKLVKSIHFRRSYSTTKRGHFLDHTVHICIKRASFFTSVIQYWFTLCFDVQQRRDRGRTMKKRQFSPVWVHIFRWTDCLRKWK